MTKLTIDLECPNCYRKFKQTLEDMCPGRSRTCPHCRTVIEFSGDDASKIQRAVDDLERTLKRVSGTTRIKF